MKINSVSIDRPFVLAPLAGYTDIAFRLLCREYGAGLCYSEMISCHGLVYEQKNTLAMLRTVAAERPVAMQLFGADPVMMGEAAAILSSHPIDCIDINMGCPVKKVTKKGAGAALMRDPQRAAAIITAVCANSRVPVTVKIRTGWSQQSIVAVDFARMVEDAGAAAIAVHGRTWADGFSGEPDWQSIAQVKKAVTIPVIGNGDVLSYQEGVQRMAESGCDAVMVGRGALGRPWVFSAAANDAPSLSYRLAALGRHLALIDRFYEPDRILAKIKNHAGKYFKGHHNAAGIRKRIYRATSFAALERLISSLSG